MFSTGRTATDEYIPMLGRARTVLVSTVATIPFAVAYVQRLLHVTLATSVQHLAPGVLLALVTAAPLAALRLNGWTDAPAVALGTGLALAGYGLFAWVVLRVWSAGSLRVLVTAVFGRP